jgi:hypothetical protein
MVGVKYTSGTEGAYVRGTNLLGRGTAAGAISWNPTTGDSFKK